MHYLTLGSCLKNEESYIVDFIKYHRYVGVEHFVFLDREYGPLNDLIGKEPDVEIIHFPELPENNHMEGWGKLIRHNTGKTHWLALIDADQALVPAKTHDVRGVLKNYEDFASLQINWRTFGSSRLEKREPGSVYERLLLRAPDGCIYDAHTQFICQPHRTLPIKTNEPHFPLVYENEILVNTNKEQIVVNKTVSLNPNTPLSFNIPPLYDTMWVAHYTNKSKEEFINKNNKGRADILGTKIPMTQFEEYDVWCNEVKEDRVLGLWNAANQQK